MLRILSFFLIFFFTLSFFAASEDSPAVQAAKRERERRAKIKTDVRVYTNKDIQDYVAKHPSIPASAQSSPADAATQTQTAEALDPYEKEEQYWRGRYAEAAGRINAVKDHINQLQAQVDDLTRAFYATKMLSDRERINDVRNKLLEEIETTKTELEEANNALEELLEEGRKAGALPGWLRD